MSISVDIADRLYDFSDEECAALAVAGFQEELGIDDAGILAIWSNEADLRREELERRIFDAVDRNGSEKRAREAIPAGVTLFIDGV